MLALMDAKTHSASVRIPADLFDRLEKNKRRAGGAFRTISGDF